jgi:hypothetical protein
MGAYPAVKLPDGTTCTSGPQCKLHGNMHSFMSQVNKQIKTQNKAAETESLENKTPVEIDTKLADIYNEYYKIRAEKQQYETYLKNARKQLDPTERHYSPRNEESAKQSVIRYTAKIQEIGQKADAVLKKTEPYDAEYQRRGRWTRAFLVDNNSGHVHKSTSCSTCYPTTEFVWLPEYSGKDEAGVVDDAGSAACTTCFPDAPVASRNRTSRIESPERREARVARETIAAEKKAAAEIKGITTPDGTPLRTKGYGVVKTARTAEIEAVSIRTYMLADDNRVQGRTGWASDDNRQDYASLVKALAHKKNTTYEAEDAYLKAKAQKKYNKEWV